LFTLELVIIGDQNHSSKTFLGFLMESYLYLIVLL